MGNKRILVDVPERFHQQVKEKALEKKMTIRKVLLTLLEKWLKRR